MLVLEPNGVIVPFGDTDEDFEGAIERVDVPVADTLRDRCVDRDAVVVAEEDLLGNDECVAKGLAEAVFVEDIVDVPERVAVVVLETDVEEVLVRVGHGVTEGHVEAEDVFDARAVLVDVTV